MPASGSALAVGLLPLRTLSVAIDSLVISSTSSRRLATALGCCPNPTSRSGVTDPERRPALEEEEPLVMRRGGEGRLPPPPSDSELLDFFFGSRSLRETVHMLTAMR